MDFLNAIKKSNWKVKKKSFKKKREHFFEMNIRPEPKVCLKKC